MNWWDGLKDAGFNDGKNPFTDGNYVLEISRIRTHKGWEGGSFLIIEFATVQADNGVQPGTPRNAPPIPLDGKNLRMALADLNTFIYELFGLNRTDPASVPLAMQLASRMTDASNPFMGCQIAAEARTIDVKASQRNPTGKFCKPRWFNYPGNPKPYTAVLATPAGPQALPTVSQPHFALQGGQPPTAWGAPPPPPPPPPAARPANLPPNYIRADGAWWDGKDWVKS